MVNSISFTRRETIAGTGTAISQRISSTRQPVPTEPMITITRPRIEAILSEAGLEMTPQRYAMIESLGKTDQPQSSDEVWQQLQRLHPRPSRESIEKSLLKLQERGVVLEDRTANVARYRLNLSLPSLIADELDED